MVAAAGMAGRPDRVVEEELEDGEDCPARKKGLLACCALTQMLWKTLRALNRPGRARTAVEGQRVAELAAGRQALRRVLAELRGEVRAKQALELQVCPVPKPSERDVRRPCVHKTSPYKTDLLGKR